MNNEIIETMNNVGKTNYEAVKALYSINTKVAEQIVEQQMALINLSMEYFTSQMELVGKSKDYKDIFTAQTSLMNEASEKVQGIARNTVDIINESKDEVSEWVEKGVEDATSIVPFAKSA